MKLYTLHSTLYTCIFVCIALTGCKTKEYIPVVEHHTDTLRVVQHHRDSIYLHDSTFVREYVQGDTVRVITEMWHTKFRDRLKTDTIYRSRTDSVPVPYPVTKEVKKPLSLIHYYYSINTRYFLSNMHQDYKLVLDLQIHYLHELLFVEILFCH